MWSEHMCSINIIIIINCNYIIFKITIIKANQSNCVRLCVCVCGIMYTSKVSQVDVLDTVFTITYSKETKTL